MTDPASKKRVLILDDERLIADTLALIFSGDGYEARAAYSAEHAMEILDDWLPQFALIDVGLPGISGIEFALRVKAQLPTCRLSLFSGLDDDSDDLSPVGANSHSFEVFRKPVHPTHLLRYASQALKSS